MIDRPNIFWIITDTTREKAGNDTHSKLKIYEKIEKDGAIVFENVYTTAPSSTMSLASIVTGRFAYELYYNKYFFSI